MDLTRRDILKKSAMGGGGLAAIPGLAAFLEACSSPQGGAVSGGGGQTRSVKLAVVTHGQGSDPFWSVVKNGVTQAGKDMGVSVTYDAPPTFDMVAMSQLIDAQVAKKPDGLIVSIPDASALSKSITAAVSAGIPVVSINSGSDVYKQLGILTHIGQTEELAGITGGEQMGAAGVRNGLVVNQEQGNAGLEARARGFQAGLGKSGGTSTTLVVDLKNPTDTQQKVSAALSKNYDGILTLGPTGAGPTIKALQDGGKLGKIKLATFDLSADVLTNIDQGNMLFAIDQQQYLQGYLPIVFLTLYKLFLLMPGGGQPVLTGPALVKKDTAAKVIDLTKRGIR
ncbi:MAG: sugar ABC transporter substrate-binding protein [Candidatus Dormibacteraeota bacterium]|nr:sugar ABC transporter substrate-binding protein [Candidatus Dormibacteraeota bacterium]